MRIQCDTLKYARLLRRKGIKSDMADEFISTLTQIDILNLYSKHEVDSMLSESIEKVFVKQDLKLAEQRREFDVQLREQSTELLASRPWMIGTVITVGLSLAAYLSALIRYTH